MQKSFQMLDIDSNKESTKVISSSSAKINGNEPKIAKTVQKRTVMINQSLVLRSSFLEELVI